VSYRWKHEICPYEMASYLNLDDMDSLAAKINDRAPDTFLAVPGKPQLEVNKYFKKRNEESKEGVCIVKNQDVRSAAQIKTLKRVRLLTQS
jgi:hypothetical protein